MAINIKHNLAIFASGSGSNAKKIIQHFSSAKNAAVVLIACNRPAAGVLNIAQENQIPVLLLEKEKFFRGNGYVQELKAAGVTFIVLAGFLWKIPGKIIKAYPGKIINIHPALLPAYGGKGMYGNYVHEAVIAAGEKESGITIHFVDEFYDHGKHIFQARCPVFAGDTPEKLAQRIHSLEHTYYAVTIEELLTKFSLADN